MIGKKKNLLDQIDILLILNYSNFCHFYASHERRIFFFFLVKTREIEYKINEDGWLLLGRAKKLKNRLNRENRKKNNRTVKKTD
jgi:hypothetical protein